MPPAEAVLPPVKDGAAICVALCLKICQDGGAIVGTTWETVLQTLLAHDLISQSYQATQVCKRRCCARVEGSRPKKTRGTDVCSCANCSQLTGSYFEKLFRKCTSATLQMYAALGRRVCRVLVVCQTHGCCTLSQVSEKGHPRRAQEGQHERRARRSHAQACAVGVRVQFCHARAAPLCFGCHWQQAQHWQHRPGAIFLRPSALHHC
jgi:hypothetical protein